MNAILLILGIIALTGARGVNVNGHASGNGTQKPQITQGYYNPTHFPKLKMNSTALARNG